MSSDKKMVNGVKILGGMNYNLKDKDDSNEKESNSETVEISIDELIVNINESLENLDQTLYEEYLTNPTIFKIVKALRDENYSKITPKKRIILFTKLNAITSEFFNGMFASDVFISEEPIDNRVIYVNNDGVYLYKNIFNSKNGGLSILEKYIYSIRKFVATSVTDLAFTFDIDPDKLKGIAREYYDNMSTSILRNSWKNYIENELDVEYASQPIVIDSIMLVEKIMGEYCKELYKVYGVIDKGMSGILYDYMNHKKKHNSYLKERKRMLKKYRENIKKYDQEIELYDKYLQATSGDVSSYSDDDFYALFNMNYYNALNLDEDGLLVKRLNNITNELVRRPFKDFDLTNVEFPKYEFSYDGENKTISLKRMYKEEETIEEITNTMHALVITLQDVSLVAQKNKLFKFNNEQEKDDYMEMAKWCDMKNHDYSDPYDNEVVKDGLNIIMQKVSEMYSDIQKTTQDAINKSEFIPHGKTMLQYQDKESYYDFHEFRNCHTKQEIYDSLMEYVRLDTKDMEKKGVKENAKTTR